MIESRAVEFFDAQFRRQASCGERELNPFERAVLADARDFRAEGRFDAVACIGLRMFFDCETAVRLAARWRGWVGPGGTLKQFRTLIPRNSAPAGDLR